MKNVIGVYNPYGLIQKAGKRKTIKKYKNKKYKKSKKTRKYY
jgi:hypothetical protein